MSQRRSVRAFAWAWLLACAALLAFGAALMPRRRRRKLKGDSQNAGRRRRQLGLPAEWIRTRTASTSRGATHMMVVDEVSGKVIGDIPDTMGIHGVALATDLGKGFTSNGGEATVTVFDLKTLKPLDQDQDHRR